MSRRCSFFVLAMSLATWLTTMGCSTPNLSRYKVHLQTEVPRAKQPNMELAAAFSLDPAMPGTNTPGPWRLAAVQSISSETER